MSMPKVSVFTCSHDRPDLLRAAVESLRRQTDPDWEQLIYDDASTDARVRETLAWAENDPRVRVWRRGVNLDRPAVLWNEMLDYARGRYFTALDDDNEKLPRFVEVMAGELDANPALDLVTCGFVVVRENGSKEADYHLNLSTCISELDRISTCDGGAMLYRRELFERAGYFSEALRTNEDWDWTRRAVRVGVWKNLHECLATYRSHDQQRMKRCAALGNDADVARVKGRVVYPKLGVRVVRPAPSRLTRSQEDACSSIDRAVIAIPWVKTGVNLGVVISPFQLTTDDIVAGVAGCERAISIHMEDPYALEANLARVRALRERISEAWVCTNDASTVSHYRDLVGDRVMVCPSLGVDDEVAAATPIAERDIDVLLCGYAYPSRRRFVREWLPLVRDFRVLLVGDGWLEEVEEMGLTEMSTLVVLPTQNLAATYAFHRRARAVVCLHRVHGDCSDGPVEPTTVNRGFMEGYLGARVFVDRSRERHPFESGSVIWYESPADLALRLRRYFASSDDRAERFAAWCAVAHTYRTRVARILNCVRAPRFLAEIP